MGFRAVQWLMKQVSGLDAAQLAIMSRAAFHCLDDDAFLKRSQHWLAKHSGMCVRNFRRHERKLEKLELLVRGDDGYRLPQFWAFEHSGQDVRSKADKLSAPLTLPYLEGLNTGKYSRAREETENSGTLKPFVHAVCRMCDPPHEFRVQDSYFDTEPRRFACPQFVRSLSKNSTKEVIPK
jgi:hypothetical protein